MSVLGLNKSVDSSLDSSFSDVRSRLKSDTNCHHQKIHLHKIFQLPQDISKGTQYFFNIHAAFFYFFSGVEGFIKIRPEPILFSLRNSLSDISKDFFINDRVPNDFASDSHLYIIGIQYVAFGTMFGKSSLAKVAFENLGGISSQFLASKPDVELWRKLLATLNASCNTKEDYAEVFRGAADCFAYFEKCANHTFASAATSHLAPSCLIEPEPNIN